MSSLKNSLRHSAIDMLTAPNILRSANRAIKEEVTSLRKDGHISLGKLFNQEECASLRNAMSKAIENDQCKFNDHSNYHVISSPMKLDPCIEKAFSKSIMDIVSEYFRRDGYLADADCRRVYPANTKEIQKQGSSTSDWHKDIRGRQLKIMIYLTDVSPTDSTFSFASSYSVYDVSIKHHGITFVADPVC